jgi:hypothetical protein
MIKQQMPLIFNQNTQHEKFWSSASWQSGWDRKTERCIYLNRPVFRGARRVLKSGVSTSGWLRHLFLTCSRISRCVTVRAVYCWFRWLLALLRLRKVSKVYIHISKKVDRGSSISWHNVDLLMFSLTIYVCPRY